jgi:hypothetical protein
MSGITLQAGQWYRSRGGDICFVVGKSAVFASGDDCWVVEESHGATETFTEDGFFLSVRSEHPRDLVEHLPGCDGFDWEPPEPIEPPKPIEPPEGWRLLTEGEIISINDIWLYNGEWRNFSFDEAVVCGLSWTSKNHPYARKIYPKYRPFQTPKEFAPHFDRAVKFTNSPWPFRIIGSSREGVCVSVKEFSWMQAFNYLTFFDGSPFGVEVSQ